MRKHMICHIVKSAAKCLAGILLLTLLWGCSSLAWGCAGCAGFGSDIYVRAHLEVENDHLTRLEIQWQFSEMLSHTLFWEYDVDQDGRLDAAEEKVLANFFLETLRPADYFTTVSINGRKLDVLLFANPLLEWQPTRAHFRFSIPLQQPIGDVLHLTLHTMDPDHRFMFYYVNNSVTSNNPAGYLLSDNSDVFPQVLEIIIQPESAAAVRLPSKEDEAMIEARHNDEK